MAAITNKLGPGTLTIGATGSEVDFSCQVTAAHVDWTADAEDAVQVLCGESVPGARVYSAVLAGTLFQDLDAAGIVAYSWEHKGEQVPFTFTPVTASAATVTGDLILDPLSIGGDEAGSNMTSDYEFAIVGDPVFTPAVATGMEAEEAPAEEAA
jgi:hypothetical protein